MKSLNKKITLFFPIALILYELPLYFSNNLFLPALVEITKSFRVSNSIAQLSIAFWFLGAATLQIVLGPLADHYGQKRILLSGGIVFILATFLCSCTHSIHWFFISRFFQGCVVSTILVTGYAAIHEVMEREQAIKTLSWMGSITILAPAVGPLLGSFLLQWMNWRALFTVLDVFTVLSLYGLYHFMPRDKAILETFELKKIMLNYQTILTNIEFWKYTLFFCFLFASLMAWNTLSPFYLMDYLKLSFIQFGFIQTLVFGVFIVGINLKGVVNYSLENVIKPGLFLTTLYFTVTVWTLMYHPQHLIWLITSLLLFCISAGLIFYSLHRKAIELPKASMGTILAVFATLMNLFGFLGSLTARTIQF